MRIGLDVSQHQLGWNEILARTQHAESAGFEGAWIFDHFTALYGDPKGPCMEAWTLLAALAAATSTIRLGTLVTGITYRHPSILVAEAVTVDHISNGRVELAVGAAWHEPEHRRLGIPFPPASERVELLDESLQIMRILMKGDVQSFRGAHFTLEDAWYRPLPVQKPHIPIWIGGHGERVLRLAGRHADAWHSFGGLDAMAERAAIVDAAAEKAGRDPRSILRAASLDLSQPPDDALRDAEAARDAGIGYLIAGWPSEGRARLDQFTERALAEIAGWTM